jgi:hypothetical protein
MNEGPGVHGLGFLLDLTRWWKPYLADSTRGSGCWWRDHEATDFRFRKWFKRRTLETGRGHIAIVRTREAVDPRPKHLRPLFFPTMWIQDRSSCLKTPSVRNEPGDLWEVWSKRALHQCS